MRVGIFYIEAGPADGLGKTLPLLGANVRLMKDTAKRPDGYFVLAWHNRRIDEFAGAPYELDMAPLLRGLHKTCPFQPPVDLPKGLRFKPPQAQPRRFVQLGREWRLGARSEVLTPL